MIVEKIVRKVTQSETITFYDFINLFCHSSLFIRTDRKLKAMCPLRYLYHVLLFLLSNVLLASSVEWKAYFDPKAVIVKTATQQRIRLILSDLSDETIENINEPNYIQLRSENDRLATIKNQDVKFFELERNNKSWDARFDVSGVFLGE